MVETVTSETKVVTDGEVEGSEPTAEQIAKMAADNKLAAEAAKWRKSTRDAQAEASAIKAERDALQKQIEDGTATGKEALSEAATLKRELADLRTKDRARDEREKALEAKTKTNAIRSKLAEIAAEAKLIEPGAASRLLSEHAEVDADDSVVFRVKDPDTKESIKVDATVENLKKYGLLPGIFLPPAGKTGTGARGVTDPSGVRGDVEGVDMERAKTDTEYYKKNRVAIMAARSKH